MTAIELIHCLQHERLKQQDRPEPEPPPTNAHIVRQNSRKVRFTQTQDTETHALDNDLETNNETPNTFTNKIFTATSDENEPLDTIYETHHWSFHCHNTCQELDKDLLRYDLPLGMGINDPMETENNPLFAHETFELDPLDRELPTLTVKTIEVEVEPIQSDQGANVSITPFCHLLHNYSSIRQFSVGHASKDGPKMAKIGSGKMELLTDTGRKIYTKMYFVPAATGTILSPDFMCTESNGQYCLFHIDSYTDTGRGLLRFCDTGQQNCDQVKLKRKNGLWFLAQQIQLPTIRTPHTNSLTRLQEAELWSLRLGSPGERQMATLPKNVTGTPQRLTPHKFRVVDEVVDANIRKALKGITDRSATVFGERLSIDFSFVRASSVQYKQQKGMKRIVKSRQGYTATLTIVDRKTRRIFAFPTKGKSPPLKIIDSFLTKYQLPNNGTRFIRTDQGGELAKSSKFRQLLLQHNCILEPTGSDAASESGLAERPNATLTNMTRRLLYLSGLPPQYWADAILHAVYLYNRTVHTAIGITPYEAHLGIKPDLSRLRMFGSRVLCKIAGKRNAKLDHHVFKGIFIGYGATDKHIRYIDSITSQEKVATHAVFDEAHYTASTRPPGPQLLYSIGTPTDTEPVTCIDKDSITNAPYPCIPSHKPHPIKRAKHIPLPLQEYSHQQAVSARAAKTDAIWTQKDVWNVNFSPNRFEYATTIEVKMD